MKKYSVLSMVFNIFAILLFVAGIILTTATKQSNLGLVFIPIGFTFLSLGILFGRKVNAAEEKEKEKLNK